MSNLMAKNICLKVYKYLPNDPYVGSLHRKLVTSHSHLKPIMCENSLTVLACISCGYSTVSVDGTVSSRWLWYGWDLTA